VARKREIIVLSAARPFLDSHVQLPDFPYY
jgi:hypothetical protein